MSFSSQLYPGEKIYNDSTPFEEFDSPEGMGRGLDLGLRGPRGYSDVVGVSPFPQELMVPRSEWQARIQEKEERKTRISDYLLHFNSPCKNQKQTNYCWGFGPTRCMELIRLVQNQEMVSLSPASACAQIKNFRNVGGWGGEFLEYVITHGLYPSSLWPDTAISSSYVTDTGKAIALDYRVLEWFALVPRNYDQHISCLLHDIPVAVGLNYWSHEVCDIDAVWLDGEACPRFQNSWDATWPAPGANGMSVRQGSRRYADDAVAPTVLPAA